MAMHTPLSRRALLARLAGLSALGVLAACRRTPESAALATAPPATAATPARPVTPYQLPPLPYPNDALEPHIDARTMEIHHDRHHAAYVTNLNAALQNHPDLASLGIEELLRNLDRVPEAARLAVRNNGGGHANHALFWQIMGPGGGGPPSGPIAQALDRAFGGFDAFRQQLTQAGVGRFGSGWAWLVAAPGGGLVISSTPNQDTPLMEGRAPLLGVDVWEHAYYLKYQNRRPDYLAAWFNTINWDEVNRRYQQAPR
jgi:Fe-Mn family superoxide dismutase